MKIIAKIFVVLVACLLVGCLEIPELTPGEESKFAEKYISKIIDKDYQYIERYIAPEIRNQLTKKKFYEVARQFPKGEIKSIELIGVHINIFNGNWQGSYTFEYEFSDGWAIGSATLKKIDTEYAVLGFNVLRTEGSQKELNKFNFVEKGILHYYIIIMVVIVPIFILVTTYYCVCTPIEKNKWLWVLFVLVGFGELSINWTTGQYIFNPLTIQFLGAGGGSGGEYSPLILSISIPIGAIVFWLKRKKFIEKGLTNGS